MTTISIIGSGFVGSATGKFLASEGNKVIFCDVREEVVENLKIEGFQATTDIENAVLNSDLSFITVATPSTENGIDLKYFIPAAEQCGKALAKKKGFHAFVVKSTTIPTTTEKHFITTLEKFSGKKADRDFGVVYNPEFLTEIAHSWTSDPSYARNHRNEDKLVIGEGKDKRAGDMLLSLYKNLNSPVFRTDYRTAELIKYANNCRLAAAVSFSNEIFLLCQKLGIDSQVVMDAVAADKRIGRYGSVHGKSFGGKCFPKDLRAIINFAEKELGIEPNLLKSVEKVNLHMKEKYGVRE